MWGEIDLQKWKETPCISGRPATEEDIENGIAVFAIPSGSEAYDVELPLCAIQIDQDSGEKKLGIAIQIEKAPEGVFVGIRYLNGGNGVGTVNEFELYREPTEEFGT